MRTCRLEDFFAGTRQDAALLSDDDFDRAGPGTLAPYRRLVVFDEFTGWDRPGASTWNGPLPVPPRVVQP